MQLCAKARTIRIMRLESLHKMPQSPSLAALFSRAEVSAERHRQLTHRRSAAVFHRLKHLVTNTNTCGPVFTAAAAPERPFSMSATEAPGPNHAIQTATAHAVPRPLTPHEPNKDWAWEEPATAAHVTALGLARRQGPLRYRQGYRVAGVSPG